MKESNSKSVLWNPLVGTISFLENRETAFEIQITQSSEYAADYSFYSY